MANTLIYGPIGSGKTYNVVKEFILPALSKNRHVYTNIDVQMEDDPPNMPWLAAYRFSRYMKKDVRGLLHLGTFQELSEFITLNTLDDTGLRIPKSSVVIIDECQMIFDYLGINKVDKRIYHFLSYARHFGLDLVFTSQSVGLVNKFVVELCNQYIELTSMKQRTKLLRNTYVLDYRDKLYSNVLDHRIKKLDLSIFTLYKSSFKNEDDLFGQFLPAGVFMALLPVAIVIVLVSVLIYGGGTSKMFFKF